MGKAGTTSQESFLEWEQINPHDAKLKEKALKELIEAWNNAKDNRSEGLRWGDEVEYQIIQLDHQHKEALLSLEQGTVLDNAEAGDTRYEWQPEYAKYMAESAPRRPYGSQVPDLASVHVSMAKRRKELKALLESDADPFTLTLFPLLGTPQNKYTGDTESLEHPTYNSSRYVPDELVSSRSRYTSLESNARARRGKPMSVKLPMYRDSNTTLVPGNAIDLEGTIFGPGACGLQVTMETKDVREACEMHDQLCVLGPIMLALTASTPIFRGYLADVDARWNTISQTYDDRTEEEMGKVAPRWSACPLYLGESLSAELDNSTSPAEDNVRSQLEEAGMSRKLAHYYANHFTRSIFLVTQADLDEDAAADGPTLWTRLSGTVFPHVRLKIPENKTDGWRIEFRPMEVQFTDFENAACAVFVTLFRQMAAKHKLDFRIAIEKVHQDIDKAHTRDAWSRERFWWRRVRVSDSEPGKLYTDKQATMLSLDEIFNGETTKTDLPGAIGLVPAIRQDLSDFQQADKQHSGSEPELRKVHAYLDFIRDRASGARPTGARLMRDMVHKHKEYQKDSKITLAICYDIVKAVKDMVDQDLAGVLG